jgi:hypothetical protein
LLRSGRIIDPFHQINNFCRLEMGSLLYVEYGF